MTAAEAGLSTAREELEYTRIRAPYAGIVSARHVEVGEVVRPGQPIMSGLSLQRLRVNVDIPQSIIDPVRKHGAAWVQFDGERVAAESLTFFPFADARSKTFRVRVNLPETDAVLYPGMFVKVGFVIARHERLLVPEVAVVRRSELTAVYVVTDGAITLRQVRLGQRHDGGFEVLAGLAANERVALDPVQADLERRRLVAAGARNG